MRCPRKYFYRYVLGWERSFPNHHLAFGTAWHLAVEHLVRNGYTNDSIEEATFVFYHKYKQEIGELFSDDDLSPKDPANGILSLKNFAAIFRKDAAMYEVLKTEVAGPVLIAPEMVMYFKLDWLLREKASGKVLYIDQKTSQRKYSNWGDHYVLSTQMLLYLHVLYCLFPIEQIGESKVRCSFFYKRSNTEFEEHPLYKTPDQMQAWLARTITWFKMAKTDFDILLEDDALEDRVMMSFPQNDNACFDFGRECEYFAFCTSWGNPLKNCSDTPLGFHLAFWNPMEAEGIREKLSLIGGEDVNS